MKYKFLKEIIKKKDTKKNFSVITNIKNGQMEIYEPKGKISKDFERYLKKIEKFFIQKKTGIIDHTDLFVETFLQPPKVIIIGAVHISEYLNEFLKNFKFEVIVIDPRSHFSLQKKFLKTKIINKWPEEAFKEIETDTSSALITLTHDTKIDDPALKYALKNKFSYIGALGSKKTHTKRCERLINDGFTKDQIKTIYGPVGLKIGGKSSSEIALSIISQLIQVSNEKIFTQ